MVVLGALGKRRHSQCPARRTLPRELGGPVNQARQAFAELPADEVVIIFDEAVTSVRTPKRPTGRSPEFATVPRAD